MSQKHGQLISLKIFFIPDPQRNHTRLFIDWNYCFSVVWRTPINSFWNQNISPRYSECAGAAAYFLTATSHISWCFYSCSTLNLLFCAIKCFDFFFKSQHSFTVMLKKKQKTLQFMSGLHLLLTMQFFLTICLQSSVALSYAFILKWWALTRTVRSPSAGTDYTSLTLVFAKSSRLQAVVPSPNQTVQQVLVLPPVLCCGCEVLPVALK